MFLNSIPTQSCKASNITRSPISSSHSRTSRTHTSCPYQSLRPAIISWSAFVPAKCSVTSFTSRRTIQSAENHPNPVPMLVSVSMLMAVVRTRLSIPLSTTNWTTEWWAVCDGWLGLVTELLLVIVRTICDILDTVKRDNAKLCDSIEWRKMEFWWSSDENGDKPSSLVVFVVFFTI